MGQIPLKIVSRYIYPIYAHVYVLGVGDEGRAQQRLGKVDWVFLKRIQQQDSYIRGTKVKWKIV